MTMDPPPALTSSSPAICCLIPSLPDDLAILCIARVPRSHHPFLASVSRAWCAFLRSPLFFSVRLEVGASEHFLFINFRIPKDQSRWFLLDRLRPNLIPLPAPPITSTVGCSVVALGHSFVLLGGSIDGIPSNVVQIYDARFNCWRLGPPMFVPREFAAAGVISGRIYVVGGCRLINEYWAEEYRAATVGEFLYSYSYTGKIEGYDFTKDEWKTVEVIDKVLAKFFSTETLTNLGDLLCFVWEGRRKGKKMEVICAGVSVTKTDSGALQGSVEWLETIALAFPEGTLISHCISLEF